MLAIIAAVALAGSPADAAQSALADLATVKASRAKQTRWLTLANVPPGQRDDCISAVNYCLNAVSRSRIISTPELIGEDLLRIDLAAYADLKLPTSYADVFRAWENLSVQDPYFHTQGQVAVAPTAKSKTVVVKDAKGVAITAALQTVTTDGAWVGIESAAKLREATSSVGAILRADWLVAQLSSPGPYYQWAGVPTKEAEFLAGLGVNLEDINRLAADSAANLFRSSITGKPRRVVFRPSPIGGVWITQDVAKETPDKDPIRNPINYAGQKYDFDASEVFFSRPNGMWGVALFNAAGERQNAVPPQIATDHAAPAGYQELTPMVSCIRCHELHGGEGGLQPFTDEQTKLPALDPGLSDPQVAARVAELYDPRRLGRGLERAREDYAAAVDKATGLTTKEAAQVLGQVYAQQVYDPVTLPVAAAEVGLLSEVFAVALNGTTDPVLLTIQAGRKVNRKSWESSFQEAATRAVSAKAQPAEPAAEVKPAVDAAPAAVPVVDAKPEVKP